MLDAAPSHIRPFSAEASEIYDYLRTNRESGCVLPRAGLMDDIDRFVRGCKVDGIWNAIGVLYLPAVMADPLSMCVNIKAPGTNNLTAVNCEFPVGYGIKGDGATAYCINGLQVGSLPNVAQDSMHMAAWVSQHPLSAAAVQPVIGTSSAGFYLIPWHSGSVMQSANNAGGTTVTSTLNVNTQLGFRASDRGASDTVAQFQDDAKLGDEALTSTALGSGTFYLHRLTTLYSQATIAAASVGASLGDAGQAALYRRLNRLFTLAGVPG